jgi:DNA helicase TIP49 (TBP-interacting protein)
VLLVGDPGAGKTRLATGLAINLTGDLSWHGSAAGGLFVAAQ